jgi:hypothetical protein
MGRVKIDTRIVEIARIFSSDVTQVEYRRRGLSRQTRDGSEFFSAAHDEHQTL